MKKIILSAAALLLSAQLLNAQQERINAGATETTPSKAQYFSWINNTNEGPNERQTLINLEFFKWLHDEYGMILDIYAMDAGALDSKNIYGSMESERFKNIFPTGFGNITDRAAKMHTRLGIWGGPDGFGNSRDEIEQRKREMVSLCKDYNWALFKFDAVCGPLRPEMEDDFIDMMEQCRQYSPDLILLNHRLGLTKAKPYATTFLWGGEETYIDVHSSNKVTAPHNRAGALSRGLVPGLQRLTEDHGVCISSCLDYWQDDLILQAFNRSLILSPEIYGNPWLLSDDEFSLLARIYNLHRRFGDILINGVTLPDSYGESAVSRGDDKCRFITLRNNSWQTKEITVSLDEEIALKSHGRVELRRFHPAESIIGSYKYGDKVKVEVPGFRSVLLCATTKTLDEYGVKGVDYRVVRDTKDKDIEIELLSLPGEMHRVSIPKNLKAKEVTIDGKSVEMKSGKELTIKFEGEKLNEAYNRKLADMSPCTAPEDTKALYEATIFAADNNALEVRSLERSGETKFKAVEAARDAFFEQSTFVNRGIWDKNLFDGDLNTGFWASNRYGFDQRINRGCFRLDLAKSEWVEKIVIRTTSERDLQPLLIAEGNYAYVSSNLNDWERITYPADIDCVIPVNSKMQYLKLPSFPETIYEVVVYGKNGKILDPSQFRASNLFASNFATTTAWKSEITLDEVAEGSYLCVALNGKHGIEGAYAAAKIDGEYVGAPNRAPSYPTNPWEFINSRTGSNYTYYIPIDSRAAGKSIEVFVMGNAKENMELKPEVWIWTKDTPYSKKKMIIKR